MTQEDADKAWAGSDTKTEPKGETNIKDRPDLDDDSVSDGITDLTFSRRVTEQALASGRWKYEFDPADLIADDLDLI